MRHILLLVCLVSLGLPTAASAGTPGPQLDLSLSLSDEVDDDVARQGALAAMSVQQLHRNAKWRYWIGFPSLFSGITLWHLSAQNAPRSPINSIPPAVLGSVGFSIGLGFIIKAKEYDNAATARLEGSESFGSAPRQGPAASPAFAGDVGQGPGLR